MDRMEELREAVRNSFERGTPLCEDDMYGLLQLIDEHDSRETEQFTALRTEETYQTGHDIKANITPAGVPAPMYRIDPKIPEVDYEGQEHQKSRMEYIPEKKVGLQYDE